MERRPISPDVLDIDGKSTHYKFPAVALSSITNRITGCVLSGAVGFGGVMSALGGPEALPAFIEGYKVRPRSASVSLFLSFYSLASACVDSRLEC